MSDFTIEFEFRSRRYKDAAKGLAAFGKAIQGDWERVPPILTRELEIFLKGVAARMTKDHSSPWPGTVKSPLKNLASRSGRALQSIRDSVRVEGATFDDIQGRIGGVHYLKIQETGGTITPKKAQYLTVPLPAAMDGAGVPLKRSAREWDNTFVARSKNGNLLIFQRRGKAVTPLYLLVKKVTIPPRLGMRQTLEVGKTYFVERAMKNMLKELRS